MPWGKYNHFQLTAPGAPPNNTGSDIAVVSRNAGHLEVIHITPDGSIWCYFWYGSWRNTQLRPPGTAVMGGIAAASRRPESMFFCYVTSSGSIESGRWEADWGQWRFDLQIAPPGSAALHTKLVTLCRQSENLEVIWMGPQGSIECNTWTGSG